MILSVISVIKPPAAGFEKTRESVMREFGGADDVEYVIKEYSPGKSEMGPSPDPSSPFGLRRTSSDIDIDFDFDQDSDISGIRVIRAPDTGVFDGMNQAIGASRGDWLLFLNAGDWLAVGLGKALREAVSAHPEADFLYLDGVTVDAHDGREFLRKAPDALTLGDFLHRAPVLHPCLVVRRGVMDHYTFDTGLDLAADFDLMVRLVTDGKRGIHLSRVGAFVVSGGLSEQGRLRARWQAVRSQLRHGRGTGHALRVLAAHARFLFMHAAIVGIVRRIPVLQRRARARSGGMPAGTYKS